MIEEGTAPDVVVLGLPSCGKTVFLSVLGLKYRLSVDGSRATPLGFRMSACDGITQTVVDDAQSHFARGEWPGATRAGVILPLKWDVYTGTRRIFRMSSMDVAGETFKEAFDIDVGPKMSPLHFAHPHAPSGDQDANLIPGAPGHGSSASSRAEKSEAALRLRDAVDTAKAVCFFINIALPEGDEDDLSVSERQKLENFKSGVVNMRFMIENDPSMRKRALIVLTQTHLHQNEIDRVGGPVEYLGDIYGGYAVDLCNTAKQFDIPVIAVSAVNEDSEENAIPRMRSPADISSDGLFGFLLTVSGMASADDEIAGVKDAYLEYQGAHAKYFQCTTREIQERLPLSERCKRSATAFAEACRGYLSNMDNLNGEGSGRWAIGPETAKRFLAATMSDVEVAASLLEKDFAERDQMWDASLRMAVAREMICGGKSVAKNVFNSVKAKHERLFPGIQAVDGTIYGFLECDLSKEDRSDTPDMWVERNLAEYRELFGLEMSGLRSMLDSLENKASRLSMHVGKDSFAEQFKEVNLDRLRFSSAIKDFCRRWAVKKNSDYSPLAQLLAGETEAARITHNYEISNAKAVRAKMEEERRERQRLARRKRLIAAGAALGLIAAVLFVWFFAKAAARDREAFERHAALKTATTVKEDSLLKASFPGTAAVLLEEVAREKDRVQRLLRSSSPASGEEILAARFLAESAGRECRDAASSFVVAADSYSNSMARCKKIDMEMKGIAEGLGDKTATRLIGRLAESATKLLEDADSLETACRSGCGSKEIGNLRNGLEQGYKAFKDVCNLKDSGFARAMGLICKWNALTNEIAVVRREMQVSTSNADKARAIVDRALSTGRNACVERWFAAIGKCTNEARFAAVKAHEESGSATNSLVSGFADRRRRFASSTNRVVSLWRAHGDYLGTDFRQRAAAAMRNWDRLCRYDVPSGMVAIVESLAIVDKTVKDVSSLVETGRADSLSAFSSVFSAGECLKSRLAGAVGEIKSNGPSAIAQGLSGRADKLLGEVDGIIRAAEERAKGVPGELAVLNKKRDGVIRRVKALKEDVGKTTGELSKCDGGKEFSDIRRELESINGKVSSIRIPGVPDPWKTNGVLLCKYGQALESSVREVDDSRNALNAVNERFGRSVASGKITRCDPVNTSSAINAALKEGASSIMLYLDIPDDGMHIITIYAKKVGGPLCSSADMGCNLLLASSLCQEDKSCRGKGSPYFTNSSSAESKTVVSLSGKFGKGRKGFAFAVCCRDVDKKRTCYDVRWDCMEFLVYLDGKKVDSCIVRR